MNRTFKKLAAGLALLFLGLAGAAYLAVDEIRWRVDVVALKLTGQIDGIEFSDLAHMIAPGSGFWLKPMVETRNPYSSIDNPFDSSENISAGQLIFDRDCAVCHGPEGVGNSGPSLARQHYARGDSDWSVFKIIRDGVSGSGMPTSGLNDRDTWSVVAYVRSIQQESPTEVAATARILPTVTPKMLLESSTTPEDWLTYSGAYDSQRFSQLRQITGSNAHRVAIKWVFQFGGSEQIQETSPIVNSGMMFITEAPNTVHAIDAATGKPEWTYSHRIPDDVIACCGLVNRGVAILGNTIYLGTLDSRLVALDAQNGKLKWKSELHDYRLGSSITAAPLVVHDKVLVGYGGGDFGLRGLLDAVSATDGSNIWRYYTIPEPGEPGNDTWSGDSWKTGGAPTWLTGSYDEQTGLLFWMVGNPAPDHQGDKRLGDNLYSNSVLALDLNSGQLAWHFQFTPHDEHDWDSNQIPVLVDREWHGEQRRLLLLANRNGFFYVLDRDTGEFLLAKAFAKQNWAETIDSTGRPVLNADTIPTTEGKITWPSPNGATNWQSPTYSQNTGLLYVPALEFGQIMFKDVEIAEYEVGKLFLGGHHSRIPGEKDLYFAVRALDPATGNLIWEYKNPRREAWWKTGGLISTAGNIVFGGDGTHVFFLDAETGEELQRINVGGNINAAPITYEVNGTQYFAISAGRSLFAFALESSE